MKSGGNNTVFFYAGKKKITCLSSYRCLMEDWRFFFGQQPLKTVEGITAGGCAPTMGAGEEGAGGGGRAAGGSGAGHGPELALAAAPDGASSPQASHCSAAVGFDKVHRWGEMRVSIPMCLPATPMQSIPGNAIRESPRPPLPEAFHTC
jgi:hypothetical protein